MKKNVGMIDMLFRLVFGAVLLYIGFMDNPIISDGLPKTIIGIFAFVPFLTGLLKFCPLYAIIGISTCPVEKSDSEQNEA